MDPTIDAASSANTILYFGVDDMRNTTLSLRSSPTPCYVVQTLDNTKTTIRGGDLLIATIERWSLRPDQITFPGAPPMNLRDWLKAPLFSSFPLSFRADDRRFEWRKNFVGQLSLHDSSSSDTVAWFSKSRKRVENGKRVVYDAFIAIKPEYDHMRNTVIVSCLLAEHKLRMKEKKVAVAEAANAITFGSTLRT